ncbi:MAG: BON domain-containing protein [Brachymonas sp.]|nr:BON domain-containing protein [Brachymonas sp.]
MHRSDSTSSSSTRRRWPALLRTVVLSGVLASSLSACVPLVVTGVVGGILLATDRRSSGAQLDDEAIELRGSSRINAALQNRGSVSITSYNRVVLLTGQVFSQADRDMVEATAKTLPNVRYIVNEIAVGPIYPSGTVDALTSTRVKTALVGSRNVQSNAVKVTTENGVVYLMGIVTQQESDRAAEVASGVSGVRKVVKVFEIVNDAAINSPLPAGAVPVNATPVAPGGAYAPNTPYAPYTPYPSSQPQGGTYVPNPYAPAPGTVGAPIGAPVGTTTP